ncbi:hypothetical protein DMB66_12685 [Actinoplanes sp. ATCC 53533]|uniref:DUF4350 domain-containing protein n=1 Tax=Actinoplanes sp. ATCC 53533 TaxID=1288362 RepID=UPI000F78D067|nr:DUF4350 domain-containing protein [Actinoplanes sp. ATCC 53533]RSM68814.1 hypothetical protein DMB66_12685 [Actinoplanes sp. ATCC 53533]
MKSRRWLRFALPLAVVAGLATMTGVAHVVQQPDPTDASFLSPTSDAGDGARQLADGLAGAGVRVTVRTSSEKAIADANARANAGGPVTVFVTTPGLVHPSYLERMAALPAQVRVVLVAPGRNELDLAGIDVDVLGPRWTATAPQPGCSAGFASDAGPAAVWRWRYGAAAYPAVRCYDDGLIEFDTDRASMTLVGAADPFRNDRADEHGNRALARGLLARAPTVIWLDLHKREPDPDDETGRPDPASPDSGREGDGEGDQGGGDQPGGDFPQDDPEGDPQDGGQANGGSQGGNGVADSPLARAFPPAVWATLALLALAALALAAASARRLGAPVAEPLPVRVRAAETVRGLGGLYRRAHARSTSLATLQSAARARLAEHYGLAADAPADEVAELVATTVGRPFLEIRQILSGAVEDSDEELARAATTVQNLVRFVTGQQNWQQGPDEGNVT